MRFERPCYEPPVFDLAYAARRDFWHVDTHVHIASNHGCGVKQAVEVAYARGLDAMAVLGHDSEGSFQEARDYASEVAASLRIPSLEILWACEMSTQEHNQPAGHIAVLAPKQPTTFPYQRIFSPRELIQEVYQTMPGDFCLDIVHPEHTVSYWAGRRRSIPTGVMFTPSLCEWLLASPQYLRLMGMELAHHASLQIQPVALERLLQIAASFDLAALGGSDAHQARHVGGAVTAVPSGMSFFAAVERRKTVALRNRAVKAPGYAEFFLHGGLLSRAGSYLTAILSRRAGDKTEIGKSSGVREQSVSSKALAEYGLQLRFLRRGVISPRTLPG